MRRLLDVEFELLVLGGVYPAHWPAPAMNSLTPTEAAELYIEDKATDDVADRTVETYRSELRAFLSWLDGSHGGAETIRDVDGLTLKQYKSDSAEHAHGTVYNRLRTVRALLRWAASVDAHDRQTVEDIELERPQDVRSGTVNAEEAEAILDHLERFHYASREHVAFLLLWATGCRVGAVRSFDVSDYHPDGGWIQAAHRPPQTTLKNGEEGERPIALPPEVCGVIDDYTEHNRIPQESAGREPLLTTRNGRVSKNTVRYTLYALTRPCWRGGDCPDGKAPEDCEAAQAKHSANECPHNNSPHDVRRGRLTDYRRRDKPKAVISDRCDVSVDVLEEHYNTMTEQEKMEQRRGYL